MDDYWGNPHDLGNLHMGLSNVVHGYLEQDADDAEATTVTIMVVVTVNDADDAPYVYYDII